jgi:hypothetical protein
MPKTTANVTQSHSARYLSSHHSVHSAVEFQLKQDEAMSEHVYYSVF